MERERKSKRLGSGTCPICGNSRAYVVSQTKTGWISTVCKPAYGGCNTQSFHRYEQSALKVIGLIRKWDRSEDRKRLMPDIPAGRHVDAADLQPDEPPEPAPPTEQEKSAFVEWLTRERGA